MTTERACISCLMLLVCGTLIWMVLEFKKTKTIDFNHYVQKNLLDENDDDDDLHSLKGTKIPETAASLMGRFFKFAIAQFLESRKVIFN